MRVNSSYRSPMWCGCHGVIPADCAHTGTESSATTITRIDGSRTAAGMNAAPIHPAWHTVTPMAKRSAVRLRPASERAARSHRAASEVRSTT